MKPCPFCGSDHVELDEYNADGWFMIAVMCNSCQALGPSSCVIPDDLGEGRRQAVKLWEDAPRRTSNAREIKKRLGWKESSPEQQLSNLDKYLDGLR